jgi:hypothetical protein
MIPRNLLFSVAIMFLVSVAMGVYVWRTRSHDVALGTGAAASTHVTPPASGPAEQVTFYVAYDDRDVLRKESVGMPLPSQRQQRAEELLRALISIYTVKPSPHPLGAGSELRNIYFVDPDLAVIDVNETFADAHPSGVLEEDLTVASLIETLAANTPGVARVKILVDGKPRETLAGHADLTDFYDVAAIHELAGELQATQ